MIMSSGKILRVSDDASEYEWSSANELLSVTDAGTRDVRGSFLYDPTGKRIRTTWTDENRDTDELFRMYLGESPVMEMREDGSHRIYVYGDGRLLATADYAGPDGEPEIHYYLLDHLGSTIAVLDEEGHAVWPAPGSNPDGYQKYQPYGEFASDPGELGSSIPSFTGKFTDPGTGNHYFNARYHTSDTGTTKGPMQFSSPDPIYGNLTDPLSWNRYAYCRNNPVFYRDLSGKYITFADSDSEELFKKYFNSLEIGSQYKEDIIALMADPDCDYHLMFGGEPQRRGDQGRTYVEGPIGINRVNVQVFKKESVTFYSDQGRLAHELRHAVQFYQGRLVFIYPGSSTGEWSKNFYDVTDEFDAFDAQISHSPGDLLLYNNKLMRYANASSGPSRQRALDEEYWDLPLTEKHHYLVGIKESGYYSATDGSWYHLP